MKRALCAAGLWGAFFLAACASSAPVTRPTTAVTAPVARSEREQAIVAFGQRAWEALRAGAPSRLLYDDLDLRELMEPAGATRFSARRASLGTRVGSTVDFESLLAEAQYAGICLQGAREEDAGTVLGLRARGWVFDRALIIGRRSGGRRIAAWIEGTFVFTDAGFGALDIERVEAPRWEHSDLELAPCDMAIRDDLPEGAR